MLYPCFNTSCLHCISRSSPFDNDSQPGPSQSLIGNRYSQVNFLIFTSPCTWPFVGESSLNGHVLHTDFHYHIEAKFYAEVMCVREFTCKVI